MGVLASCPEMGETGCWAQGQWGQSPGGPLGLQDCINSLHLEAVPQGSMDEFPVSTLEDPTAEWETGRAGTGMPEASRGSEVNSLNLCHTAGLGSESHLGGPCLSWGQQGKGTNGRMGEPRKGTEGMI